jgi:hypothetical protein
LHGANGGVIFEKSFWWVANENEQKFLELTLFRFCLIKY